MTSKSPRGGRGPQLSERDVAVLGSLYLFRLLTTDYVQRLWLDNGTLSSRRRRAQMLMRRLYEADLVTRFNRKGATTKVCYLWGLTAQGMAALGLPGRFGKRRRRVWQGKPYFQDHTLAVAELYVRLVEWCRQGSARLRRFDPEPATWRLFTGPGGETKSLKPDAYVRVAIGTLQLVWFVEVDLGTESLPTIRDKCQTYLRYFRSGLEQQRSGVFPRVLWLVPDQRRADNITAVAKKLMAHSPNLFTVALLSDGSSVLTKPPADWPAGQETA